MTNAETDVNFLNQVYAPDTVNCSKNEYRFEKITVV